MEDRDVQTLALLEVVKEFDFTKEEMAAVMISCLQFVYGDDEKKIIEHLYRVKNSIKN